MPDHRVTEADLDRWVASGLINREQREAIERDLEAHGRGESELTLTTLLYYGGGLLVLVAYGIFLGFQWADLASAGRVAIAAASFVFFAGVSQVLLQSKRFRLPGELLQVVAVALVPLLMFAVLDAAGVWPDEPVNARFDYQSAHEAYQFELTWARIALGGATLIAAAVAFRISRSPFVLIAAVLSIASLFIDASLLVQRPGEEYQWHTAQSIMVAVLGTAGFIAGIMLRDWGDRDYSVWLYGAGMAGLAAGLGTQAFPSDAAAGWGALWMIVALTVLALSLPLQQRLFAAAGLLAVFVYLGKLVFDVFQSANAALALVVLGVLVLGAGMLYQRLTERHFAPAQPK